MRILIVSSYLPFPLYSGGHIRLFNLIKQLSKKHKITLICEKRDFQTEKDVAELKKICEKVITVARKKQWSTKNILKTGFSKYPFLIIGHTLPAMKKAIVQVLNEKRYDVIHVETSYVFQNVPKTYIPVVLAEHNIEYNVYARYSAASSWYLRPFLLLDVYKIKYWEELFWRKATKLIAVSEKEKQQMGRADAVVIPNGVDLETYTFKKIKGTKTKRVLFIGDFKWVQNRNSLEFILEKVWPLIQTEASKKDIKILLWVVGKNIPDSLKNLGDKTTLFDESAPSETQKIYQKSDVLLSPITVGGGTSYKILESMASGVPVVTTTLGVEGLGAKHKEHALVGKTENELASLTIELLTDSKLYEQIAQNARKLIEEKFSWDEIALRLEKVYEDTKNNR